MLEHYHRLWVAASEAMDVIESDRTTKTLRLGDEAMDLNHVSPDELAVLIQFYKKVGERAERRVTAMRGKEL